MNILKKLTNFLAVFSALTLSSVCIAGPNSILGLQIDFPQINYTSFGSAQGANYDSGSSTLSLTTTPVFLTFTSGGTQEFILNGSMSLSATIDASGLLSGGSYSISGNVTDTATNTAYGGVLLTGAVTDYGLSDVGGPGGTDLADFELTVTGGSLKPLYDAAGTGAASVGTLEGSSYGGDFSSSWSALRAKGDVGPIPDIDPVPPATIGFWKNHPEAWPVSNLVICGNSLSQNQLIGVLTTPSRGDKTIIMAKQLIAAMLNEATGNSCPTIPDAETWLCDHGGIGASIKKWDGGEDLKDTLDNFNNGNGC